LEPVSKLRFRSDISTMMYRRDYCLSLDALFYKDIYNAMASKRQKRQRSPRKKTMRSRRMRKTTLGTKGRAKTKTRRAKTRRAPRRSRKTNTSRRTRIQRGKGDRRVNIGERVEELYIPRPKTNRYRLGRYPDDGPVVTHLNDKYGKPIFKDSNKPVRRHGQHPEFRGRPEGTPRTPQPIYHGDISKPMERHGAYGYPLSPAEGGMSSGVGTTGRRYDDLPSDEEDEDDISGLHPTSKGNSGGCRGGQCFGRWFGR